jgi:hypothetical protein
MGHKENIDYAVTYDPEYHWWSVGCLMCGEFIEHKSFTTAFAFTAKHRKCEAAS